MINPYFLWVERKIIFFYLFFIFLIFRPSAIFAAEEIANDDCLACHTTIDENFFAASIHGSNLCASCHNDIQEIPPPEKLAKVNCGNCHRFEAKIYNASGHGEAKKHGAPAATCLGCHGDGHRVVSTHDKFSPVNRMNIASTCAVCHEDQKMMEPFKLLETMPVKSYLMTVHGQALAKKGVVGSAVCSDCHGSHDLYAPTNPKSKIYRANVETTCGKCHENVLKTYQRSVHGKAAAAGKWEAPVCTDCHGEHNILARLDPNSKVYSTSVSEKVCGQYHASEKITTKYRLPTDRLKTYMESYHGLAGKFGRNMVANCASCHGAHDILPSSDPESSVNKKNLQQTCGKCDPNVGKQLAMGSVHMKPSVHSDRIVYYVTMAYIFLIIMVIGGMILHNLLDFCFKLKQHYLRKKEKSKNTRFTANERVQHLVLSVTFIMLAYTGFALRFPDAWWAFPFSMVGGAAGLTGAACCIAQWPLFFAG